MASPHVSPRNRRHLWLVLGLTASLAALYSGVRWFSDSSETTAVPYQFVRDLGTNWGDLITVANVTMRDRRQGADRIGFFRARDGTIWGLPLAAPKNDQPPRGCAPPDLATAAVTDSLPGNLGAIIGASDFDADLRAGESSVHLLIRDPQGGIRWRRVAGGEHTSRLGITCREKPSLQNRNREPFARYHYFRIARINQTGD